MIIIDLGTYTAQDPALAALPARVPIGRASASEPPRAPRRGRVELLWPQVTSPPQWVSEDESGSERRFSGSDGPWVPTQSMSQGEDSDSQRTLTDPDAPAHESGSVTGSYSFDPDKTLSQSVDS